MELALAIVDSLEPMMIALGIAAAVYVFALVGIAMEIRRKD